MFGWKPQPLSQVELTMMAAPIDAVDCPLIDAHSQRMIAALSDTVNKLAQWKWHVSRNIRSNTLSATESFSKNTPLTSAGKLFRDFSEALVPLQSAAMKRWDDSSKCMKSYAKKSPTVTESTRNNLAIESHFEKMIYELCEKLIPFVNPLSPLNHAMLDLEKHIKEMREIFDSSPPQVRGKIQNAYEKFFAKEILAERVMKTIAMSRIFREEPLSPMSERKSFDASLKAFGMEDEINDREASRRARP